MNPTLDDAEELDRLLMALVEGPLSETEQLHLAVLLRDDPALQRRYLDYLLLDTLLHWDQSTEALSPRPAPRRRWIARKAWRMFAFAVAASVLIGAGIWLAHLFPLSSASPLPVATVKQVEGSAFTDSSRGRRLAAAGQTLFSGQGIETVGADAAAMLELADGTQVTVEADTWVSAVSDESGHGKHLEVIRGVVALDVVPQTSGKPLVVSTPHVRTEVLGTHFSLTVAAEATRVEVDQGEVRLARREGGRTVELDAGKYAVVGDESDMKPRPLFPSDPQASQAPAHVPLEGLQLWLKSDTGILGDGGRVKEWLDQSRQHRSVRQEQLPWRPSVVEAALNGRPAVGFDGSDGFLDVSGAFADFSAGLTAFVVARPKTADKYGPFLALMTPWTNPEGDNRVEFCHFNFLGVPRVVFLVAVGRTVVGKVRSPKRESDETAHSFAIVQQPTGAVTLYQDGAPNAAGLVGLPTKVSRTDNWIGRDRKQMFHGEMFEILLYNRGLSDSERCGVEAYLRGKYFP